MGTNYYLKADACPHCGRADDRRHIGKSSTGWVFALHVYPDEGINTLEDWQQEWRKHGDEIINEYGELISPAEMMEIITERYRDTKWADNNWYGYDSEAHFHRQNHSLRGPNGLLRRQLVFGCIGYGPGTWDYIEGYFS